MKFKLPDLKLTNQQMLTVVAVGIAVCVVLAVYAFRGAVFPSPTPNLQPSGEAGPGGAVPTPNFRHPLTGTRSASEVQKPFVFSVIIDNMIDAWPASGLEDAFLVIEAPVEAGISRFLAFYGEDQTVEKIGPVRSARPYYIDWAEEFDAFFAHVGGSNAALELLASNATFDLNEYSWAQYFWRSKNRGAPHNVYTSSELLSAALTQWREQGVMPETDYETWFFKDDEASGVDAPNVMVDFSTPTYRVTWDYDPQTKRYQRLQAGEPHVVESGVQLFGSNVAIMVTTVQILDEIGRRAIETVGEGKAFVLQDGRVVEGTWGKGSAQERLRFYDADGVEISWNAGQTWVQVVPSEEYVTITAASP